MTHLEQISGIRNDIYLIVGALGTTAGKVKNLEREHYSFGELEAIHSAMLNAAAQFRGGVFFQRPSADSEIANRFDRCRELEVRAGVAVEQSQLAQIDSLMADAKAVNDMLKQLALDIEQLKADHPHQYDDALNWAAKDALKEYRRINAPLRAIRKDATFTNGITAADGMAGLYKAFNHLDSATTNKPQAKTGADHES